MNLISSSQPNFIRLTTSHFIMEFPISTLSIVRYLFETANLRSFFFAIIIIIVVLFQIPCMCFSCKL